MWDLDSEFEETKPEDHKKIFQAKKETKKPSPKEQAKSKEKGEKKEKKGEPKAEKKEEKEENDLLSRVMKKYASSEEAEGQLGVVAKLKENSQQRRIESFFERPESKKSEVQLSLVSKKVPRSKGQSRSSGKRKKMNLLDSDEEEDWSGESEEEWEADE